MARTTRGGVTMFEKEAKEYSIENYETCLYDDFPYTNDARAREQSFKDGAEFGYNKATGDVKMIIGNLIYVLTILGVDDLNAVKEAKQFLKDSVE